MAKKSSSTMQKLL